MDWFHSLLSAGIGAGIGTLSVFLWRWIKKPKPVNRHEISKLRAEIIQSIKNRHTGTDLGREFKADLEIDWVQREKRVEYLRIYAKFAENFELPEISNTVTVLQNAAFYSKDKPHGYTQYRTQVELTEDHIRLYTAFHTSLKEEPSLPTTKEELWGKWEDEREIIAYAFSRPVEDADKILSIIRDRHIYDLDSIKALLATMDTPGSSAVSSGAL